MDLDYRPCVGIMVLNVSGEVWMGHRPVIHNDEFANSDRRWQMPQGGIDDGESPYDAAIRELWEETGIKDVVLLGEIDDWLYYDLPQDLIGTALRGKWRGQKQRWFAFRFEGDDSAVDITREPVEFDEWSWIPMDNVVEKIVDFKRDVYKRVVKDFSSLA